MSDNEKVPYNPPALCLFVDEESSIGPHDASVVGHGAPHTVATLSEDSTHTGGGGTQQLSCDGHQYPEHGWKANLTVLGAFIALFCTFGQTNAFGTFQAWYAAHQLRHMPASTISWIGSLQLWTFFFSGAAVGRLFDAYGPTSLMIAGTACYLASMVFTSISNRYYQYILSQGILFGLSVGLLFYPPIASISTHFSRYRATAIGIAVAGSSVGGVVYPIIFQRLFEHIGFAWGVRISGLASGVACIAATMMVTSLSRQKKPGPYFDVKTITDLRFALLAAGSCFVALGLFVPFFYIVEYAGHLSLPNHMSFYVLAVMNAGGVLGRIAPAYISDNIGRFNLLVPSAFLAGLSCVVVWLFAKSLGSVMLFSSLYGFFSGAFISLVTPCVAQISDIGQIGTRIGMLYSIISFPSLLGGPTAGALLARYRGSFSPMIIFAGTSIMVGSLFILASKFAINKRILARV
ncbi:hypothetical protein M413DRAFT_78073 [Hebeloma cylindrosporum]|uniref:Major facilitator superfamily (MFS) profile domain-containing protein n=1 Tax=Hebeloma cylindrosporum TaxID=76867 RepID=A0A0C2Y664_HEBCY|nr:hypothetical protein M413DRAFT_78073 [Hebeloma cylindrosporum h7]